MDIEKLKAEFEQSECFKRLEHVAQYTFFEFGAYIKRTDVPRDVEKKIEKLVSGLIFSWKAWKEAKAQAVPKWISVEDKEPDCGETVLITWSDAPDVEPEKDFMDIDLDTGALYWSNYNDGDEPSHWMPLPKPVAQEQKG